DFPLKKFDIRRPRLPLVLIRQRKHLVCHVETIYLPGRSHAFCREQHVDAASRAKIQYRFSWPERCQRGGVTTSERRQYGFFGKLRRLRFAIEVGTDRITTSAYRCRTAAIAPRL